MENTVCIMRSAPGGGKSSYIKNNFPDALVCSADHYFTNELTGEYIWGADKIGAAHNQCKQNFSNALKLKHPLIVVDNTNIKLRDLKYYFDNAKKHSYTIKIIRMFVPLQILLGRNVHNVPDNVVIKMFNEMEDIPYNWGVKELIVNGY